jgi:hypothetical protein
MTILDAYCGYCHASHCHLCLQGSNLERMEVCYTEMLNNFANTTTTKTEELQTRYEIISKLL